MQRKVLGPLVGVLALVAVLPLSYNDTIPAGDVRKYENAVYTLFGVEGFGALRVTASQRVVLNAEDDAAVERAARKVKILCNN